jgi:hypothetical protein
MGQKASRALASRLEKGMEQYRHEMEQDIRSNIAEKQRRATPGGFTDPNALNAGFTRGTSAPIRQDMEQEAFLQSQQQSASHEMPDDLIQFLNDMGPVQRRERKPKLRQHQLEQLDQEGRQVRDMPIMEEVDRFTTSRTTNFSRKEEEQGVFAGLTGREFYKFLQRNKAVSESTISSILENSTANDDEKKQYSKLLENSYKYLQIPVIMQDTDGEYIGVAPERVAEMELMKLKVVPESQVRLVLSIKDPQET